GRVPDTGRDGGDWTEVRPRRWKERRQMKGGFNGFRQRSHSRGRSLSPNRRYPFCTGHNRDQMVSRDSDRSIRYRSRYGKEDDRRHHCYSPQPSLRTDHHQHHDRRQRCSSCYTGSRRQASYHRRYRNHNEDHITGSGLAHNKVCVNDVVLGSLESGSGTEKLQGCDKDNLGTDLKRYVSFYFTNFPAQLPRFYLRKGVEVCGMLDDVFVPKKRNVHGKPYGFVKFVNVRDVSKLTNALNNVSFGHFRVQARVASLERTDTKKRPFSGAENGGHKKVENVVAKEVRDRPLTTSTAGVGGVADTAKLGPEKKSGEDILAATEKRESNLSEGVNVGDVLVKLRGSQKRVQHKSQQFKTTSTTISGGETVPVVQNRIADAGFYDLVIIPMGADTIFVRSESEEFFKLLFSNWVRWEPGVVPFRRGAWVRLYGVLLQAWNEIFFRLCVLDCGRFLRMDSCKLDKDRVRRMDIFSPRVLLATPDLETIKKVEKVLVDGVLVEIKLVEEWGYAMGEDACLFENDNASEASNYDIEAGIGDQEASHNVDLLVDNIRPISSRAEPVEDTIVGTAVHVTVCVDKNPESGDPSQGSGVGVVRLLWGQSIQATGVIFSTRKKIKARISRGDGNHRDARKSLKKRQGRGMHRHSLHTLKKVARMPVSSEENQSSASVNNDWENSVVMQGNNRMAVDDVWGVGKAIGGVARRLSGARVFNEDRFVEYKGSWGVEKRKEVCKLVRAQNPFIVCLQETKLQLCDIWDLAEVEMWPSVSYEHVMWCHGRFVKSDEEFYIANVYAPCDNSAKQRLWDSLSARIQLLDGKRVCVCEDFNAVKSVEESRSIRVGHSNLDHILFQRFIDDNTLIDLPLGGRKFTWYKGDGSSMSRLDRFLLSEEWCMAWPNCAQVAQLRGLSDHCPLVLSANEEDWGPRPARMLKCWSDIPGYTSFVIDKWNSWQVDGWGFVLKEKFKMIKSAMKVWHAAHAQNLPSRIDTLKDRLSVLDVKGEEEELIDAELEELHGITSNIQSLSRLNASICWQQSRTRWLKEGDANSKYFHPVLASRRRRNSFSSIQVEGVTVEGVNPIRQAVASHFTFHFKAISVDRPVVDNLIFNRLSPTECGSLTKPFSAVEVKAAVWDCDSYKSPGPDGVDSPQRLNDFRPISLVGSLYKILAKVLANRLRLVIGGVISESQSAFVKDRQILDGILVVNDVVDEARLNVLMKVVVERNMFTGYSVGAQNPVSVSHLQFADDTLLIGIKSWANVRTLRAVLVLFESMSGLKVNFSKSMLVGVNIHASWLHEAAFALCCKVGRMSFLYLSLPIGGDPTRWLSGIW
ncbi:cysteine-rich receptor-like protein kinase, partial [Trifolium pratense]